ncbi:MAG: carboxypeptidase-like regulatory domain-containing protein [Caldisericaceae bacterium]|nr:carboxypeptidase-like regulatory domain-containing protein [Caldisericaceae bacterium]
MGKRSWWVIVFLLIVSGGISMISAATTGKIAGVVKDADTGEPLPGVNIFIKGTTLGSATDLEGNYFILNVPPGNYTVTAQMVGYATVNMENVRVNAGRTTIVNFSLKSELLQGEEITIVAEREVIPRDVASSQVTIVAKEAVETSPIGDFSNLIRLQAGIEAGPSPEDIVIRGGGGDQILMVVDGATLVDERRNRPILNLPLSAIESIDIITGGFNAKYGNVRSGMLRINTKEGTDKYSGYLDVRVSPPHYKHFSKDKYWTQDWNIYAGPGSMDSSEYFIGWNKWTEQRNSDNDPSNDITPEGARRLWEWWHRPIKYGAEGPADYLVEGSFGGPVPGLKKTSFFFSGRRQFVTSVIPYYKTSSESKLGRTRSSYMLKLTSRLTDKLKLSFSGLYGVQDWLGYRWGTSRNFIGLSYFDQHEQLFKYSMDMSPYIQTTQMYSLKLTHTLSPRTFYNFLVEYQNIDDERYWVERDTTPRFEYEPGKWIDGTPWGHSDVGTVQDQLAMYRTISGPAVLDSSKTTTMHMKFDIESQVNKSNNVKAGFELNYTKLKEDIRWIERGRNQTDNWQKWTVHPIRLAGYVQDKLEWEGMIANFGLRLDYVNANADYFTDPWSPYFTSDKIDSIDFTPKEKSRGRINIQPRLGVSHPIGEHTKIYFNYGHFYSVPLNTQYYGVVLGGVGTHKLSTLGNPNLKTPRTVAYELGYDQDLFNQILVHIAGYYKDVTNQVAQVRYHGKFGDVDYISFSNQNYADIYGFEVRVEKKYGRFLYAWLNYNWVKTKSGYIGFQDIYQDKRLPAIRYGAEPVEGIVRPSFRGTLDLHTPLEYGQLWGGWALNVLYTWREGSKFYFDDDPSPDRKPNMQWVARSNMDLRVSKRFKIFGLEPEVYMIINNLFNQKYLNRWAFTNEQWRDYLMSLKVPWGEGERKGHDRVGIYPHDGKNQHVKIDVSPQNKWAMFLYPRQFYFGLRFSF